MTRILTIIFLLIIGFSLTAQDRQYYKRIGIDSLYLDIYHPEMEKDGAKPVVVFFFGGGWKKWNFDKFVPHAKYFAKRGLVSIVVDYRTFNRDGISPAACLRDAKSSIRYLRTHADKLGIDPDRIIAAGGSAGGHLAAACAVVEGFNEPSDDLSISERPNALVLFNPVIDNGPGGYGYDRVKEYYLGFSPLHNLHYDTPPTLFMVGTEDKYIPVETARYYQKVMQKMGLRCDLKLYEGQKHGFFNHHHFDMYHKTLLDMDEFLQSLGYLKKNPVVTIE
jgi:acetyl esterase/lipase